MKKSKPPIRLFAFAGILLFALLFVSFPTSASAQSTSADLVQRVIDRINDYRVRHGCPPLVPNELLLRAAQGHAEDMARLDFFGHVSADGKTLMQRYAAIGYHYLWAGENIMSWQSSPEAVVDWWYNESPPNDPHRRNLLKCTFSEIGVGYYYLENDTGKVASRRYWVADFAQPASQPQSAHVVTAPAATAASTPTLTRVITPTRVLPTPTRRVSPTATRLANLTCNTIPARPFLNIPADNARLSNTILWLDWSDSPCTKRYVLVIKARGSPASRVIRVRNFKSSEIITPQLKTGVTYAWRVRACNQIGCSPRTPWRLVNIGARTSQSQ